MINSFAIIALAALIHASFQLSVSMLTLLSGHAIGTKTSQAKLLRLISGFLTGAVLMTTLLLVFVSFILQNSFGHTIPLLAWAISCGLLLGLGIAVWAFYYRREKGTTLWLPRGIARFLSNRTKATRHGAEAFSLGMSSVIAELIFIFAPLSVSGLVLIQLPPLWQLLGVGLYTLLATFPLLTVMALIGSGHKISHIQKWREANKRFLQFAAGSGLIILGTYIYIDQIVTVSTGGLR